MQGTWVVTYAETVDGDRVAGVVVKGQNEEEALKNAADYFDDWGFTEPEIVATLIPSLFTEPIYISIGTH